MTVILENKQLQSKRSNEDSEIVKDWREAHDFAFRSWSPFLVEAQKDLACYLGDQWDHGEREFLRNQRRNALVFNRVRRNIKMVTGYERKTRHSLIAEPIENSDEMTANQLSAVLLWLFNRENMHNTMSDAFEGALKTGINLIQMSLDFTEDPVNGDVKIARTPYNQFLLDPRFTRRDLSDCEFVLQRRFLSRDAAKSLLPFRSEDIDMLRSTGMDGRFPNAMPSGKSHNRDTLRFDEYWVRKTKNMKVLVDLETGDTREIPKDKVSRERLEAIVQGVPNIRIIDKVVPTVHLNVLVEEQLMFSGEDPWGIGDFPFVPVMAFWDPEHSTGNKHFHNGTPGRDDVGHFFSENHSGDFALKLQSLVRCVRDPQSEANKRRSKMLDILDSQINSGWIATEDSVTNKKSLYRSGQGEVIWKKEGAEHPQKIPAADIPPGLFQMSSQMDNDILEIAGINEELMGMEADSTGQISGVLAKLRQGAGLTVLQDLFDNFRLSQKLLGKKMIKMVQSNWSPQKVQRIINEEPSQEFFSKQFGKYDVSVEEAVETSSQRALAYMQLIQAKQAGIPIPNQILIDYLPVQDKDKLKQAIAQEEQAAQMVQLAQEEDRQRAARLTDSATEQNIALAQERRARIHSDLALNAERVSEAEENRASAALDRAKTISEIARMGDERFFKLVQFVQLLENQESADRDDIQRRIDAQAFNLGARPTDLNNQVQQAQLSEHQNLASQNLGAIQ